ncbi:MAG: Crp/Fnr family transcriptional regulator [Gammaproteobacteria bacterium]|nr:Crp/Fnr family transcriptional regulator [Gammaproteobacteria bacterium]
MTPQQQQLLAYFAQLQDQDAHTLLRFAAFLAQGQSASAVLVNTASVIPQPNLLPRPDQERVVDAIKRLTGSYPMLDKKKLLHQTAGLVAEHVMSGKPAKLVIDELEAVFRRAYDQFTAQQRGS